MLIPTDVIKETDDPSTPLHSCFFLPTLITSYSAASDHSVLKVR